MAPCGAGDSGAPLLLSVSPGGRLDCTGATSTGKTGLQAEAGPVAVAVVVATSSSSISSSSRWPGGKLWRQGGAPALTDAPPQVVDGTILHRLTYAPLQGGDDTMLDDSYKAPQTDASLNDDD